MKVERLQIDYAFAPRFQDLFPLHISVEIDMQGSIISFSANDVVNGSVFESDGALILQNLKFRQPNETLPCLLRVRWNPQANLSAVTRLGRFADLRHLLRVSGTSGVEVTIEVLSPEAFSIGQLEALESVSRSFILAKARLGFIDPTDGLPTNLEVGEVIALEREVVREFVDGNGLSRSVPYFQPNRPLAALLDLKSISDDDIRLAEIRQPPTAPDSLAIEMRYGWQESPLGPESKMRFELPPPRNLNSLGHALFQEGGVKLLRGRAPGSTNLITQGEAHSPYLEFSGVGTSRDGYAVRATSLSLSLTPQRGSDRAGNLLFEDQWLPISGQNGGGRLVSNLLVIVKRKEEIIFRSDQPFIATYQVMPEKLTLKDIFTITGDIRKLMPFRLELTSSDPRIIEFWLPPGDQSKPTLRTLDQVVSAVYFGNGCKLSARILKIPSPVPLEVDIYTMPNPADLGTVVPPPLKAELSAWSDAHFNRQGLANNSSLELIFKNGLLAGQIANRNPNSTSEEILLRVESPDGSAADPHLNYLPNGQGFTASVTELRPGANRVTLSASKPINRLIDGPSSVTVILNGVLPRDVSLQSSMAPEGIVSVFRRAAGSFVWTYSRAVSGRFEYSPPNGAAVLEQQPVAYQLASGGKAATLHRAVGEHRLRFVAENDYGTTGSVVIVFNALRPNLTATFLTSGIPHSQTDPHYVGHSVTNLDLTIDTRFTLNFEIAHNTQQFESLRDDGAAHTRRFTVPPAGLDEGMNSFQFSFANEFASETIVVGIRRRLNIFDVNGEFAIDVLDTRQEALLELRDVAPPNLLPVIIGELTSGFSTPIGGIDLPTPTGLRSVSWEIRDQHPNNNTAPSTLDFEISYQAISAGPDFEMQASFMEIAPEDVVEDDPDSTRFALNTLLDQSGLSGDGYWSKARVRGRIGSLSIPIKTKRLR